LIFGELEPVYRRIHFKIGERKGFHQSWKKVWSRVKVGLILKGKQAS
jgi:hypothetical protein